MFVRARGVYRLWFMPFLGRVYVTFILCAA
jgi:hypothetical protein